MSEFWKRKIRKWISIFDFDRDGVISKDDLLTMAIRYSKFWEEDQQMAEHLKTQFANVWDVLMKNAEVGDRTTLTADDIIVSVGKQRYDPELMKHFSGMLRALHNMLDVKEVGYLQENEYQRLLSQVGVPDPSFVKMAFKEIDVNGDGKLRIEEFINAFFDFFLSDYEESPNAIFFGPLDD